MPASVSLSSLSWSAPDGTPVFTGLTQSFGAGRTGIVGRNGIGKSTLLRLISGTLRPTSGQVQLSGSLAMMRQDAVAQPGETIADLCGARAALHLLGRAEAGLAGADELIDADWTLPSRLEAALLLCGLRADPLAPLANLSGGQRNRAALAALILQQPDILLMDEPTNNLDHQGRRLVNDVIAARTGCTIIVSHDRALLDHMDAIVELTSLGATRHGGNYSAFRQRKTAELAAAEHDLAHAEASRKDIARRAQQAVERKARKDSAGRRARDRGDQPRIQLDAARGRAEASGGAGTRLRDARREAAEQALTAAREKIEVLQPLRMDIAPTGLTPGKIVLQLNNLTGGYVPGHPIIRNLSFTLTGPRRIAISGPNGSGKSTLLKLITGQIPPQHGQADLRVPFAMLDQHVGSLNTQQTLRDTFLRLNPNMDMNAAHAALARFGFRAADGLRQADSLSGGERLRAGLACALGVLPPPMLLILDEPTNHLDLDGIAALEATLKAYDGAVLVISHDEAFLGSLALDGTIPLGT